MKKSPPTHSAPQIAAHGEDYLELVLQSTNIGVWDWNVQSGECNIDARWAEIAGYTKDELTPFTINTLLAMIPDEDKAHVQEKLETHWQNDDSIYKSEYRILHKSGKTIWVEDAGRVVEWTSSKKPLRMVGTHQDITERKNNEDQLKKLSRIASESINGAVITDREGRIEWINDGFVRISGYYLDEVKGKKPGDVLVGQDTDPAISKKMSDAIRSGKGFHVEILNYHKDGTPYWVEIQCSALLDEQGAVQGFMAIETDITSAKKTAIRLERQQQMLEQMSDLGNIGAWEVDFVTSEIYWSSMTKRIHEVPDDYQPVLGSAIKFYKEGYSRDRIQVLVKNAIEHGESFNEELQMVTAANREIWIATRGKPEFVDGVCTRLFGSFQEITERKKAEVELIAAKESAEAGRKQKSDFLASMSHEIRTPINGVIGMLNLLTKTELTQHQSRQVGLARSSAQSLLSLINDILDFSKVEAGKLELEEVTFDLIRLLGEFAQSNAFRCQEKGVEFILDTSQVKHTVVSGDPGRLRQVLTNLTSNATKFTDSGHVLVSCRTEETYRGICLNVTVEDSGIGIPDEKITALFDSFTQADSSTTRKYGGTGLGLAIVKNLCQLMGGDIEASSIPGKGSTFSFSLVLQPAEHAYAMENPALTLKALHALVVENHDVSYAVIDRLLSNIGHTAHRVADGEQTIHALSASSDYDFILLSQNLPDIQGLHLAKRIQALAKAKDIPVILVCPLSSSNDQLKRKNTNVIACIAKPIVVEDLIAAIDRVTNTKNMPLDDGRIPFVSQKYVLPVLDGSEQTIAWHDDTRILLVEDNPVNQEVATGLLHEFGLTCEMAANGIEALEALRTSSGQFPFSLVLMDCFMPDMDGYEATRNIRKGNVGELLKNIPIIAMTANAMKGDKEKCINAGMDDYISKPIDPDVLLSTLRKWLLNEASSNDVDGSENTEVASNDTQGSASQNDEPIWDRDALSRRVKGKRERMGKLITMFLDSTPARMEDLTQAMQEEDISQVQFLAHTIKGVSSNLGAACLSAWMKKIETAAAEGGGPLLSGAEKSQLRAVFDETVSAFTDFLSATDP